MICSSRLSNSLSFHSNLVTFTQFWKLQVLSIEDVTYCIYFLFSCYTFIPTHSPHTTVFGFQNRNQGDLLVCARVAGHRRRSRSSYRLLLSSIRSADVFHNPTHRPLTQNLEQDNTLNATTSLNKHRQFYIIVFSYTTGFLVLRCLILLFSIFFLHY